MSTAFNYFILINDFGHTWLRLFCHKTSINVSIVAQTIADNVHLKLFQYTVRKKNFICKMTPILISSQFNKICNLERCVPIVDISIRR